MASVNKVIIVGNLGRDPETRYLPSGDCVTNIAVATSYKHKDKNTGEQKELTEWHRVSFFGKLAEIVGQYVKKGSSIYIEGRLQTRKYQKDGQDHYATDIVAETMQMLGGKPSGDAAPAGQQGYQGGTGQRDAASPAPKGYQGARPQHKPAPNFSDMDDDIPFVFNLTGCDVQATSKQLTRSKAAR